MSEVYSYVKAERSRVPAGDPQGDQEQFIVHDGRPGGRFWLDDEFADRWLSILTPSAIKVYLLLCRYANRAYQTWPTKETIAERTGLQLRAVRYGLESLEESGLIRIEARGPGQPNIYTILPLPDPNGRTDTPKGRQESGAKNCTTTDVCVQKNACRQVCACNFLHSSLHAMKEVRLSTYTQDVVQEESLVKLPSSSAQDSVQKESLDRRAQKKLRESFLSARESKPPPCTAVTDATKQPASSSARHTEPPPSGPVSERESRGGAREAGLQGSALVRAPEIAPSPPRPLAQSPDDEFTGKERLAVANLTRMGYDRETLEAILREKREAGVRITSPFRYLLRTYQEREAEHSPLAPSPPDDNYVAERRARLAAARANR